MAGILRGDVVWADLDPTRGHEQGGMRPVVVLSVDEFNTRSGTIIGLAVTSRPQRAGFPFVMELNSVALPKRSWVKIGQVRTLSLDRVRNKIARVSNKELVQLLKGLNAILGA